MKLNKFQKEILDKLNDKNINKAYVLMPRHNGRALFLKQIEEWIKSDKERNKQNEPKV